MESKGCIARDNEAYSQKYKWRKNLQYKTILQREDGKSGWSNKPEESNRDKDNCKIDKRKESFEVCARRTGTKFVEQSENFSPMQELYNAFNTINCPHLLVILDCCYAGIFRWTTRKLLAVPERIYKQHYDRFIKYPSWQVLGPVAPNQEALDLVTYERGAVRGINHSPFALALLQELGHTDSQLNADLTGDGVITIPELYLYVDKGVNRSRGERQTPGFWSLWHEYDRGEFIFIKPNFNPAKNLTVAPEPNPSNTPYWGLKSFEEKHASFLFGRKALVEELHRRLSQTNHLITVVLGASGSSKSTLVKAGLIPALRQRSQWYILELMCPNRSPFTALARAIVPVEKPKLIDRLSQVNFLDKASKPKDRNGQDK